MHEVWDIIKSLNMIPNQFSVILITCQYAYPSQFMEKNNTILTKLFTTYRCW